MKRNDISSFNKVSIKFWPSDNGNLWVRQLPNYVSPFSLFGTFLQIKKFISTQRNIIPRITFKFRYWSIVFSYNSISLDMLLKKIGLNIVKVQIGSCLLLGRSWCWLLGCQSRGGGQLLEYRNPLEYIILIQNSKQTNKQSSYHCLVKKNHPKYFSFAIKDFFNIWICSTLW